MDLSLLVALLLLPVIALLYLARVLCSRECRGYVRIDEGGNLDYRESGGWLWWRVVLFLIVLPALIVLDRLLA